MKPFVLHLIYFRKLGLSPSFNRENLSCTHTLILCTRDERTCLRDVGTWRCSHDVSALSEVSFLHDVTIDVSEVSISLNFLKVQKAEQPIIAAQPILSLTKTCMSQNNVHISSDSIRSFAIIMNRNTIIRVIIFNNSDLICRTWRLKNQF